MIGCSNRIACICKTSTRATNSGQSFLREVSITKMNRCENKKVSVGR